MHRNATSIFALPFRTKQNLKQPLVSKCSLLRRNSHCVRSEFSTSDKHLLRLSDSIKPAGLNERSMVEDVAGIGWCFSCTL